MTPRRETCRWVEAPEGLYLVRATECGASYVVIVTPDVYPYCPHCGGRIVREEGE